MSTRGCVAVKRGKGWEGVYNHFDSYPSGLGSGLWEYLQGKTQGELEEFASELLQYGDWREYLNGGVCEYCGKKGLGQPCNISGAIYGKSDTPPDPEGKHHDHSPSDSRVTPDNAAEDALWIEWVYVVNPETRTVEVFTGARGEGEHEERAYDGRRFMSPNYQYVSVGHFGLDIQPEWERLEKRGDELSEEMQGRYSREEVSSG